MPLNNKVKTVSVENKYRFKARNKIYSFFKKRKNRKNFCEIFLPLHQNFENYREKVHSRPRSMFLNLYSSGLIKIVMMKKHMTGFCVIFLFIYLCKLLKWYCKQSSCASFSLNSAKGQKLNFLHFTTFELFFWNTWSTVLIEHLLICKTHIYQLIYSIYL